MSKNTQKEVKMEQGGAGFDYLNLPEEGTTQARYNLTHELSGSHWLYNSLMGTDKPTAEVVQGYLDELADDEVLLVYGRALAIEDEATRYSAFLLYKADAWDYLMHGYIKVLLVKKVKLEDVKHLVKRDLHS